MLSTDDHGDPVFQRLATWLRAEPIDLIAFQECGDLADAGYVVNQKLPAHGRHSSAADFFG